MKKLIFTIGLLLAALSLQAQAKCANGCEHKDKITTVSWIKAHENDLDKDDKKVILIGKVIKKHNGDTYFFNDGTGTIELDSDIELPVGKAIVVRGRIDEAYLHIGPLEVNVDSWRHVNHEGQILK